PTATARAWNSSSTPASPTPRSRSPAPRRPPWPTCAASRPRPRPRSCRGSPALPRRMRRSRRPSTPPSSASANGGRAMHILADAHFWVAVAFVIFIGVLVKVGAHRMILDGLDSRAARIKTELDEAKRVRDEAEALLAEYKRKRGEADREAEAIVSA